VRRNRDRWSPVVPCIALFGFFSLGGAPADAAQYATGGPAASLGELRFHARVVPFRHGVSEGRAEYSIRIPYRQIRFVPENDRYSARLRVTVEMRNRAGAKSGYLQREAVIQSTDLAATTDSLLGEIYTLGLVVPPGTYTYKVQVEDMNAFRQGLVAKMKKQRRQGQVEGNVDLGPWLFLNPALSGLEFAWDIRGRTGQTEFTKGPYEVLPQPSGYFGNFQETISVYYELYDLPPPPEGRSYRLIERILTQSGDTVFTSTDSLRVSEGTAWPHALSIDSATLPAGHYRLTLDLEGKEGAVQAKSAGEFDVLWSSDSWSSDSWDLYEVIAATLLPSDSADVFRSLPMGEKERWAERLWRAADPTPETGDNERRTEFMRRVLYANAHFTVVERGMYTDRGRVYIRYGEPDEIQIERVPVGNKTLGYSLGSDIPSSSKSDITDTQSGIADMRAYEIWTYEHRGDELVPRYGVSAVTSGLKFVFVDDQGYGEYMLEYSSTSGHH